MTMLYAVANVLFSILPIESLACVLPSTCVANFAATTRVYDEHAQRYFQCDSISGASYLCLAHEFVSLGASAVLVFVFVMDEGSTCQALYFWLVGVHRMRCIFGRDPSHRLSNLFINSLRVVPCLMTHVLDHVFLHKFRSAPFCS